MPLLESDGTGMVKWWVDTAFAVHHDIKSYTGGMISMERGDLYSASNKQNLKNISAEAELVGVDDLMPKILWMRYFLEAQGMKVSDNVVYKYIQTAMKLKK